MSAALIKISGYVTERKRLKLVFLWMQRQGENSAVLFGSRRCPLKTWALVNQLVFLSLRMSHRRGALCPADRTTEETQRELAALKKRTSGIQGEAKGREEWAGRERSVGVLRAGWAFGMLLAGWDTCECLKALEYVGKWAVVRTQGRSLSNKNVDSLQTGYQIICHFVFRVVVEVQ